MNISQEAIVILISYSQKDVDTNCGRIFLVIVSCGLWNGLPDYVIMSDTINTFKNRLDAHWKHRDFLFHYGVSSIGESTHTARFGMIFYLLI